MELKYKPSVESESKSIHIERLNTPYQGGNWHFHEEFELFFSIKGEGVRLVGDNMDHFIDEELFLIRGGLPHLFKNDNKEESGIVDYIVLKFKEPFSENYFFSIPEFALILELLQNSKRGITFSTESIKKVKPLLIKISKAEGISKIILFLDIIKILSESTDYKYLASENFILKESKKGKKRIHKVVDYIAENYVQDISLDDLAEVACMTTNSFCRYFKNTTGKTAFQFIREYRVNKACQMLINGQKSISEICFDTGFNSFSSFNRIFKNLKNISASEYKNKFLRIERN